MVSVLVPNNNDHASTKRNPWLSAFTLGFDECPRLARGIVTLIATRMVSYPHPIPLARRRLRRRARGMDERGAASCSKEREVPPGKPGASNISDRNIPFCQMPDLPFGASWATPRSMQVPGPSGLVANGARLRVLVRISVWMAWFLPPRSLSPWRSVHNQKAAFVSDSPPCGLSAWSGVSKAFSRKHRPTEASSVVASRRPRWRSGDEHRSTGTSPAVAGNGTYRP